MSVLLPRVKQIICPVHISTTFDTSIVCCGWFVLIVKNESLVGSCDYVLSIAGWLSGRFGE